jgi:hypothetical protein
VGLSDVDVWRNLDRYDPRLLKKGLLSPLFGLV